MRYGRDMPGDVDIAASGALLSERARVEMLALLSDGRALPASELAARVGVSRPTASVHLEKLLTAGWLQVEAHGRHRYYRLADPALVEALEAIARVSPPRHTQTLRASNQGDALRQARLCYDHLAGQLGTGLTAALLREQLIEAYDGAFCLTPTGQERLGAFGLDIDQLWRARRTFARPCLDWSERRHHLAGALGAAIATQCFELGWLERRETRAVRLTDIGRQGLHATFKLEL